MPITNVIMPQFSMTMIEGVIVEWLVNKGDLVEVDQPVANIETDKITQPLLSPVKGVIQEFFAEEGSVVPVGKVVFTVGENQKDSHKIEPERPVGTQEDTSVHIIAGETVPVTKPDIILSQEQSSSDVTFKVPSSPLAKRTAKEMGVDIRAINQGSGPDGLVIRKDVEHIAKDQSSSPHITVSKEVEKQPVSETSDQDVIYPIVGVRKAIAERLSASKNNLASVTTFVEVDMTKLAQLREVLPVSYTSFVVKAISVALKDERFKVMNSLALGDDSYVIKKDINISVSVATGTSLITPVIHNAGEKNLLNIADDLKSLATKARDKRLSLKDLEGGTFTVTNSGVYGSLFYAPIINYPQLAIIGMGKIQKKPIVVDDQIQIAPMMHLCLSYDHRIIDGETGAPFLQRVRQCIENPKELFV